MPAASPSDDNAAMSIGTAAVTTEHFERSRLFQGRSLIVLNDALASHPNAATFQPLGITTAVRNHILQDVVLDGDSLILFKNGRAIAETDYCAPPEAMRRLPGEGNPTRVPDEEDLVLACNNAHSGYQHWLTQCVPAIDWSLRQNHNRPVRLLLPNLEPWQNDILMLLGYDRTPRLTLEPHTRYHLPHVACSDFLHGSTSFGICLSTLDTIRRIADAVPSLRTQDKVLYVRERNPYYGAIRNEDVVLDILRRRGVTVIEHAHLPAAERINLFRNADAIIGPLGQGLTDVLFCRPGTLLWEWMPRHQQNPSFNPWPKPQASIIGAICSKAWPIPREQACGMWISSA